MKTPTTQSLQVAAQRSTASQSNGNADLSDPSHEVKKGKYPMHFDKDELAFKVEVFMR